MGHMKDFDIRIRNGGDDAIAAVSELLPRWFPVGERLPSEDVHVLAYHSSAATVIAWRYGNAWQTDADTGGRGEVTHWMPLPEPPSP